MVDFDDLLLCTEELLAEHPAVRREEASRFDHVLVDEYQDTNGSQYRIVKALAMPATAICASWATTTSRSTAGAAPR